MTPRAESRRRRSTEEVRRLILDSAGELFAENGYDATKTRDIAQRAGVYERLLYTNFGSKEALFDAAIIEPLSELVAQYVEAWEENPEDSSPEERIEALIVGLYDFAVANRALLRASLTGPASSGDTPGRNLADQIARTLHRSLKVGAISGYERLDAPALLIDVAGMAFGVALLDDLLIPRGTRRPSRRRLIEEMIETTARGVLPRTTTTPTTR